LSHPGRIFVGFVLAWIVLDQSAHRLGSDRGEAGLAVAALTLVVLFALEWAFFATPPRVARRSLGLVAPDRRAALGAVGLSALLLLFHPAWAAATGTPLALRVDALALVPGLLAQGGVAEETLFRGYLFRHVRADHAFWPAAFLSMLPFTAVHLPLFFTQGVAVALVATLLALVVSFPLAALFEWGRNSIAGPALLHFVIQGSIKVLDLPADRRMPTALAWMAACATVPWLVFALWRPGSAVRAETGS
jgi:membrane protease YdiL (CAAX protease family)